VAHASRRPRRRRLLITSTHYWPEPTGNAPYVTGLAEYLVERGYEVMVLTTFPHYPGWRFAGRVGLAASETRRGVVVRRRLHVVPRKQSAASRAVYELTAYGTGLSGLPLRNPADVVLGICPDLASAGLARTAAAAARRPYGLIFQDVMGLAAEEAGVPGGTRVARVVRGLELAAARNAAGVGIVAEGFRSYFEAGGLNRTIHRLRNWVLSDTSAVDPRDLRAELGWTSDRLVCLHAGNMGRKQGLENLLDAALLLRGVPIEIVLAGDGHERERLERRAAERRLDNVSFLPLQPTGRYEAVLRAADVLLVNQLPSVGSMALPSKLTSYFAAGRPIVAAARASSEAAREVLAADAGVVVKPGDPGDVAAALRAMLQSPGIRVEMGERGRRYAVHVLAPDRVLPTYEGFLDALIESRGRKAHAGTG
jgi:colanic acid biosynthesis glycosyl transferase WcaI